MTLRRFIAFVIVGRVFSFDGFEGKYSEKDEEEYENRRRGVPSSSSSSLLFSDMSFFSIFPTYRHHTHFSNFLSNAHECDF